MGTTPWLLRPRALRLAGASTIDRITSGPVPLRALCPAIVGLGATMGGALVAVAPTPVLTGTAAAAVALSLVSVGARAVRVFHGLLATILVAYAFFDKGAAYIGVSPLYIGEVALFSAVISLLLVRLRFNPGWLYTLLFTFMAWGAARTIPYVQTFGILALRDAASWGYALFAIAVGLTLTRRHIEALVRWYGRLLPLFLIWVPIAGAIVYLFGAVLPRWPGPNGGITVIYVSYGQTAVHLTTIAAFIFLGLLPAMRGWRLRLPALAVLWTVDAALQAAVNRGSMVAMSAAAIAVIFARGSTRWLSFAAIGLFFVAIFALADPVIPTTRGRPLSFNQLVSNVTSIFDNTDADLEGTKEFRVQWWNKIVSYTLEGPYFWSGKGFGINLAVDDGFSAPDGSLRAPHNSHLEFLARAGVPGLVLWLAVQFSYAAALLRSAARLRSTAPWWSELHVCILVFWVAAMVNMSFDPYLQGPHGGIWFWSVFGVGLASLRLAPAAAPARPSPQQVAAGRATAHPTALLPEAVASANLVFPKHAGV